MNRKGQLKLALDTVLLYFIITAITSALCSIALFLFSNNVKFITFINSMLPRYIVPILIIVLMVFLSYKIKKEIKTEENNKYDKSLLYLIVGILLIISGIMSISTEIINLKTYIDTLSELRDHYQSSYLTKQIYIYISSTIIELVQVVIGICLLKIKSIKEYSGKC